MHNKIKISVRSLVEYVYKSGSIETGFRSAVPLSEGTRIHQRIQKLYGEEDQKEVYLHTALTFNLLNFQLEGRCDGLLIRNEERMIDEIKSVSLPLSEIDEFAYPVHWAQAKCYAFMYAKDHNLPEMTVQLTYIQSKTDEVKRFQQSYSFRELEEFILCLLESYFPYADLRIQHQQALIRSVQELAFPFSAYRNGQRKFAGAVYKTIAEGKNLFANAPTGIGKTISTLFPALKAIGEGHIHRIIYATAKTITRQAAEGAIAMMEDGGLKLKSVTITAKDKICFKEETNCQKDSCEFANGYYDRINHAVLDLLKNENMITRTTIEKYAMKHKVCPFEFSLDAAYAADAIIGDYNYIFDPRVSLKRLLEEEKKKTALLIDEAHNLVDRGREMYSSSLEKSAFLQLSRSFKGKDEGIQKSAKQVNGIFIALKKKCGENQEIAEKDPPEELFNVLEEFVQYAENYLGQTRNNTDEELLEVFFAAQNFIRIGKLYDERFVTYIQKQRNDLIIKLFCLDPSYLLQKARKGYKAAIFFSATLMPLNYYLDMLGFQEEDFILSIPSPFSKDQAKVYIQPLSTRYRDREGSIEPIVITIKNMLKGQKGNYLIFFPSYQYMENVYGRFLDEEMPMHTIIQKTGMDEREREEFLDAFQPNTAGTLLGFAVMGGIFSEGIDLQGDKLNGVFVVGVGLPQIGFERNIMKAYFQQQGKNGYDYAYTYPGMNKVLQAGGRLIRSENDTGIIVLMDDRYVQAKYQALLPEEWKDSILLRR
ncbi:ATP-dependent DNA helicase [Cytobacillus oceanisediminis]|uniref:ATP-dependent DNA helicase n=1 Tax=Cytobacillus oceanisediminis TaxID=665099 RepID=UPI001FB2B2C3|nr:ATP-dependent DNA helicase [Cytobacillus oceanisediminis]UOE57507.1 ATP-dependent DNA helicase [Cytobacillus oceanisediminis]